MATPLMRGLRERFPDVTLDYLGGERTRELEEASRLIAARYSLYGGAGLDGLLDFVEERRSAAGPYALAINLESDVVAGRATGLIAPRYVTGACIDPGTGEPLPRPAEGIDRLWSDVWNRPDLCADYPELGSQFIGEIFCQLARVETDYFRVEAPIAQPRVSAPPVLVSTGASRSARLWPGALWAQVVRGLRVRGWEVGLLGADPGVGAVYHAADVDTALVEEGALDLRGQLTLPEVAGALAQTRVFVTIDNGLMHLAAAVGTPTVALFGASPRRVWAPHVPTVQILEPADPCPLCEENRFRNEACLIPIHRCMLSIAPERVLEATLEVIGGRGDRG